jgi:hypothetical protein
MHVFTVQGSLIAHSPNCPLASMDSEFDIIPGLRYTQRISFSNFPRAFTGSAQIFSALYGVYSKFPFPAIFKFPGLFLQLFEFPNDFN